LFVSVSLIPRDSRHLYWIIQIPVPQFTVKTTLTRNAETPALSSNFPYDWKRVVVTGAPYVLNGNLCAGITNSIVVRCEYLTMSRLNCFFSQSPPPIGRSLSGRHQLCDVRPVSIREKGDNCCRLRGRSVGLREPIPQRSHSSRRRSFYRARPA
jgi:hypothetical protein